MDLPININLINHAIEQEKEQYAWELWKSMYPNMMAGFQKFIRFEDFKAKLFQKQYQYTEKTSEEIEEEMLAVVALHEGR